MSRSQNITDSGRNAEMAEVRSVPVGAGEDYEVGCSFEELRDAGRKRVSINERVVVLFYVKGEVYALDHFCYREHAVAITNT